MQNKLRFRRAMGLVGLLCAAYLGLAGWLVDLQVFRHDELSAKAEQNTHRELFQNPRRGDILDVNGNILATSVGVKTVCADPSLIASEQPAVARALAPLLQMTESDLIQKLTPRLGKNEKGEVVTNGLHYVRLARCVPEETWQRVQQAMTNLTFGVEPKPLSRAQRTFFHNLRESAVFAEPDQMRIYPNGPLAAQVVGFPSIVETNVGEHQISEIVGQDGIERSINGPAAT